MGSVQYGVAATVGRMSGLEEAIELAAEKLAKQSGDDWKTLGPLGRMSWRGEALAVLLAAAPALLRAVVAELVRPMQPARTDCVNVGGRVVDRPALRSELLAALARLSAPVPPAGTKETDEEK